MSKKSKGSKSHNNDDGEVTKEFWTISKPLEVNVSFKNERKVVRAHLKDIVDAVFDDYCREFNGWSSDKFTKTLNYKGTPATGLVFVIQKLLHIYETTVWKLDNDSRDILELNDKLARTYHGDNVSSPKVVEVIEDIIELSSLIKELDETVEILDPVFVLRISKPVESFQELVDDFLKESVRNYNSSLNKGGKKCTVIDFHTRQIIDK